jgi:hypothetical protein
MYSERVGKLVLAAVAAVGLGLIAGSCVFDTRPAEMPVGSSTEWEEPVEPEIVLSNLANSIGGRNALNYETLLTEDFTFNPDPSDSVELENYYPGAFLNWSRGTETRVARQMLDPGLTAYASLVFIPGSEKIITDTDSTYEAIQEYQLVLFGETTAVYNGTARFHVRRHSDGLWYIWRWEDNRLSGDAEEYVTWGILKGIIRATSSGGS